MKGPSRFLPYLPDFPLFPQFFLIFPFFTDFWQFSHSAPLPCPPVAMPLGQPQPNENHVNSIFSGKFEFIFKFPPSLRGSKLLRVPLFASSPLQVFVNCFQANRPTDKKKKKIMAIIWTMIFQEMIIF